MTIRCLAVGKKHESWVLPAIERYERRLRKPWVVKWEFLKHSQFEGERAKVEESERILQKLGGGAGEFAVLLDERGRNYSSPEISRLLMEQFERGTQPTLIIGGAYGVDERVRARADVVWSLSKLVFPHQLVRLILAEQVYRASEIAAGSAYHHL